jgi:hypothetical protein
LQRRPSDVEECWELLRSGSLADEPALDHLAREIAERFLDGSLDWQPACWAINTLYFLPLSLDPPESLRDQAWQIFEAFDAGEVKGPEFTVQLLAEAGIHGA